MSATKKQKSTESNYSPVKDQMRRNLQTNEYFLYAKVGGKLYRRKLGTTSARVARVRKKELLLKLEARAARVSITTTGEMTREQFCAALVAHFAAIPGYRKKPKSLETKTTLATMLEKTLPEGQVSRWTYTQLRDEWWNSDTMLSYAARTRNAMLADFRVGMKIAIKGGVRIDDPSEDIPRDKVLPAYTHIPTPEEFDAILAQIRRQDRTRFKEESANMIEFLAYSGCRIGEVREILWEDIDLKGGTILVTGGPNGTKSHLHRRVPIISRMRALLERLSYPGASGKVFRLKAPRTALETACERLGFERMKLHALRHLFGTTCIEHGAEIPVVAEWMGHQDGGKLLMKVYNHLRDSYSQRQAAKVNW